MNPSANKSAEGKGLRQWISERPVLTSALALIVIAGAIVYTVRHAHPHDEATFDFIDEETNKPSIHSIDAVPPLIGDSGKPTVVRAIYSGPPGSDGRKILYLEKYSDASKAVMEKYHEEHQHGPPPIPDPATAVWVRLPLPGSPWVTRDSTQGHRIINTN
jgi:hypothetical protein